MTEFKSMINPHAQHKFAEGGFKKTLDNYEDIYNKKTGELETKKTGQTNFYEKIQEMAELSTLENIIKRYAIDLDDNKVTEITDQLVDLTNAPTDLIEAYAMTKDLENLYNTSTTKIKEKFGSFAGFLNAFKDGTLNKKLKEVYSQQKANEIKIAEQKKLEEELKRQKELEKARQEQLKVLQQGGIKYGE